MAFVITIFIVLMLGFSASSLSLSFGAGENAVSISTLLVTTYFVFMLVSMTCISLRGNFSSYPFCTFIYHVKPTLRTYTLDSDIFKRSYDEI
jgi:hypothetical protein